MALASMLFQRKLVIHRAARLIQIRFRMVLAKKMSRQLKMLKSSVIIQKNWRSYSIKAAYNFVLRGVTSVQALIRARLSRSQFLKSLTRIILVQSILRRYLVIARLSKAVSNNFRMRSFFRRYLLWKYYGYNREERDEGRVQVRHEG